MNRLALLACVVALSMGGCQTLANNATLSPAAQIDAAKVESSAELLYNTAAHAYLTAETNGQLSPTVKAKVKGILEQMYVALLAARDAEKAGDSGTLSAKFQALQAFAAQVTLLAPSS